MRWKKKTKKPNSGDIRCSRKFLLFPKCIDDEWVWLEYVMVEKTYHSESWSAPDGYLSGFWTTNYKKII